MLAVLEVRDLEVSLNQRTILKGISFELNPGETLIIHGANGAGKTVLLRALLGLVPHHGEIRWKDGIRLGYVPQKVAVSRDLPITVRDFFALKGTTFETAAPLLKEVGFRPENISDQSLGLLSAGQFQRVLIAWAMVRDPEVLLLDEPMTGVDIEAEKAVTRIFEQTRSEKRTAVIMVTHDPDAARGEASVLHLRSSP